MLPGHRGPIRYAFSMGNELVVRGERTPIPGQIAVAGEEATRRFIEFFTANIRNRNTRAAYMRAVSDFFEWCEESGLRHLNALQPVHVAAYVEQLGKTHSAPSVKLNFNTGFLELIDLICGFGFSRPAWHYAYGV
jgi:integrase family protein with SAM-like domain